MRCRLRYLSHLPITCQFQVAELALKPPTVSNSTLSHFHNDIEKRRKIRQRRMRDERQRSRKIQIAENKKIGICEYKVVLLKTIEPTLKSDFHIKILQLTDASPRGSLKVKRHTLQRLWSAMVWNKTF